MYLRSGGGFHRVVPHGRAGLAGNRPLRAPTTHRAVGRPSGARAELRPRSRRQISATAISFDNRLCGGQSTYTKSLVAERLTLTLAEFASSLVRTWPRIVRRVRYPMGREPPQGAVTGSPLRCQQRSQILTIQSFAIAKKFMV